AASAVSRPWPLAPFKYRCATANSSEPPRSAGGVVGCASRLLLAVAAGLGAGACFSVGGVAAGASFVGSSAFSFATSLGAAVAGTLSVGLLAAVSGVSDLVATG